MTFVKIPLPTEEHCEVLFSHQWLRNEPEEVVLALQRACCRIRFQAGETLFREGDNMRYCPLVEQGELQAFRHTYQGDDKVFGQFARGEWVALAAVFMEHGRFPMNIRVLSAGQAMLIPRETLQLLGNLSQKLYTTINQIDWLTSSSAGERLADYLLRLHRTQQDTQPKAQVRLPLNRGQLATQLGIRPETLSRLMVEWQRQGYITLCNLDYLRALAAQAQRPF